MIEAKLYCNGDDCFLAWSMPWVSECWGFAIARDLTTASGQHLTGFLQNQIGFEDDQNAPHSHRHQCNGRFNATPGPIMGWDKAIGCPTRSRRSRKRPLDFQWIQWLLSQSGPSR